MSRQSVKVQPKEREKPRYDRASPFRVRWSVDGVATERNFPLEEDADAFRKTLEKAVADGVRWNARTLLPATKVDARKLRVAEWCQEFYRADAVTSAPNSRRTSGITLTRFVEVATESDVTWTTPERSAMRRWITTPGVVLPPQLVLWVKHHSLLLSELDEEMLKVIDARLRTRIEGGRLGALTAGRNVKLAKRALDHAVRAGLLTSNQWPATEDGESDRKVNKQPKPEIVVASLEEAQAVVANLRNHQPRSWTWWLMTILGLYAGLRPQETITLEVGDFTLPDEGYGSVHFTTAWNGAGGEWGTPEEDIGPTKTTRHRTVPLTPYVVCCVREYLEFTGLTEGKMFLTRSGKRPSAANWWRALNSSSTKASVSAAFYPYGLRHFAASHWLASGIEPPRVASWLGNSVSVLHATYAHAVRGGEARSLAMMSAAFEQ